MFILIGFLVFSYFVFKFLRTKARTEKQLAAIPGPKPSFLIGNLRDFKSRKDTLPAFLRYQNTYGPIIKFYTGPLVNLLVSDYKFLEFLLGKNIILNKSRVYRHLFRWIGTGLLTAGAEKWKKHRKMLIPAFHFQILEPCVEIFDRNSLRLAEILSSKVGTKQFDVFPHITLYALDVICETAMGTSVNAQGNSESEYSKKVKEMLRIVSDRGISLIEQFEPLYIFTKNYRTEKKALKILHEYTHRIIRQKKEELQNKMEAESVEDDTGVKQKKVFIDLLLEANQKEKLLTDDEIRQEVDTFMFEGHDTTASALSFALYALSMNPDVQDKVLKEQEMIFGKDRDRPMTFADLTEMKYLEMVIKETLRIYPSIPMYAREATEEVEYNGMTIPKNVTIIIFAYGVHRDPEYFPEPEKFDPERFSPENWRGKGPYSFLPFSAGPRNCIGQKFAMLEMKATISRVVRNFVIQPAPGFIPEIEAVIVMRSANGLQIRLEKREWKQT